MIKKIVQIGNSWGVIIPKALWDMMKINPVTDRIELTYENNRLIITKVPNEK